MKTTIMAVLAAVNVYGAALKKDVMLASLESLSPEELMQRCHVKPTDCNGMYKIPIDKLKALIKKKEIKKKAAELAKKIAKEKHDKRKSCAKKVPLAILKKTLDARKAGKCIKIHLKYCKDNIGKLPMKTLSKIVSHKHAVHVLKKVKAVAAAKKIADGVKAAQHMHLKDLKKA